MQSYSNLKGSGISNCFLLLQNGFRCKDVAIGGSMWCSDRLRCELKAIDWMKECMHALMFLARAIVFVSAQTGSASVPVTVLRYAVIVTTRWLSWFKCFWFVSGPTHWLKMWWFVIFHVSMIFQALRTVFLISCKISMFQCSAKDAVPICSQSIVKLEIKAMSSFFHSWASFYSTTHLPLYQWWVKSDILRRGIQDHQGEQMLFICPDRVLSITSWNNSSENGTGSQEAQFQ